MAARPLSDREVLPYLVVFVGLVVAVGYIPQPVANLWDALGAVWNVAVSVLGTIYIYQQNGGAGGQYFLQRYFALGWVVSIRWLGTVILVGIAVALLKALLGSDAEETTWYEFAIIAALEAVVYWRIGWEVRDLAQRTRVV